MRAVAVHGETLELAIADAEELASAVERLGFERAGMVFVRRFAGDAPYAAQATERFEIVAESMVQQLAGVDPVPWEEALELLIDRVGTDWTLVGSAARAVRGEPVTPNDIDIVTDEAGSERIAGALADL